MSEFQPILRSRRPATNRRPLWKHPAVLVPFALLSLLLGARLLLHASEEPPAAEVGARQVEQAPADVWDAKAMEAGSTETAGRANPSPAPAPNVFASLGLKARIV